MVLTHPPSIIASFVFVTVCHECECMCARVTSSSLCVIMVNALKTQSVEPVMVMILSGQEPSEMLTRALLCGHNSKVKS